VSSTWALRSDHSFVDASVGENRALKPFGTKADVLVGAEYDTINCAKGNCCRLGIRKWFGRSKLAPASKLKLTLDVGRA